MGFLEQYPIYRAWYKSQNGGGSGGGGLVLIMMLLVGLMLVLLAVQFVLQWIQSAVYGTVRPVLMLSPHGTTAAAGAGLAYLLARTVAPFDAETARAVVLGDDDSFTFYRRTAVALVALNATLAPFALGADITEYHLAIHLSWAVLALYGIYKFLQVLGQTVRLCLGTPNGTAYATALVAPLVASLLIDLFDVPTVYPGAAGYVLPSALLIAAALLVDRHVRPHRFGATGGSAPSVASTD